MNANPTGPPVAIITGAGSGIGAAAAHLLSRDGYRLILAGRRADRLSETGRTLATDWLPVAADIGKPDGARAIIDAALDRFGRLDALVNNAGTAPLLPIVDTTPAIIDEVYRVNALGPAYAIALAWPHFLRQRSGCIVNISTMGTIDPFPGFYAYASSKAAVNLLAKSAAIEGRPYGIRAFAIAPGAVETEMLRALFSTSDLPPARTLSPDDVAAVILQCIRGDRDAQNGETIILRSP